jgi:hypothetical protein
VVNILPRVSQTLGLLDKDFKSTIRNLFIKLKETMSEELKKSIIMSYQINSINT